MTPSMREMQPCLSVIIPCYNEERTIGELLSRVLNQSCVGEVVIVDDCSSDASFSAIQAVSDPRLKILRNEKNLGKGSSVAKAISLCTFPFIVIQDADLEYSPEEFPRLLAPLLDGIADAVFGSRFLTYNARRALYYWHRMGNNFLTTLSNALTNIDLTDMETCYKVMKSEFAKSLNIKENRFGLEPEITAKLATMHARVYEVPISYQGRTYLEGKKITWRDGFSAIRCIIKYSLPWEKSKTVAHFNKIQALGNGDRGLFGEL